MANKKNTATSGSYLKKNLMQPSPRQIPCSRPKSRHQKNALSSCATASEFHLSHRYTLARLKQCSTRSSSPRVLVWPMLPTAAHRHYVYLGLILNRILVDRSVSSRSVLYRTVCQVVSCLPNALVLQGDTKTLKKPSNHMP